MATGKKSRESSERAENSPVAWFVVLEEARAETTSEAQTAPSAS